MNPHVLALLQTDDHSTIHTDAWDKQIEYVLLQELEDETVRPLQYWSRTVMDSEKKLATAREECIVVVWPNLSLCHYL